MVLAFRSGKEGTGKHKAVDPQAAAALDAI
jgi:hypothetical protein